MYTTIESFLSDWKEESAATLKIMRTLTDASLAQKVCPEGRTLGYLAWHVVLTLGEMGGKAGLAVATQPESSPAPSAAAAIVSAYDAAARSLESHVRSQWSDAMLGDMLDMYGQMWTRSAVLDSLIRHQIHHRGQMTVLMRQAGLAVPGVCGPSREEWAAMGMPPLP